MTDMPEHLIFERFEGRADLESPSHRKIARDVFVAFDPHALVFEVHLPASHALVQELAEEYSSVELRLSNVILECRRLKVRIIAREFRRLFRRNPLIEWPEFAGFSCDANGLGEGETDTRRLVLGPDESVLTFDLPAPLSDAHPYQVYYSNTCPGLWAPDELTLLELGAPVQFCPKHPAEGFVCVFSSADFSPYERRIQAALMLFHGRNLPLALWIRHHSVSFYGYRSRDEDGCLPMGRSGAVSRDLLNAVLAGFVSMSLDKFERAYLPLRFFLLGKYADVPLEIRYLQLMTCIEAMDDTPTLKTNNTSALLGVSGDAARLINGMRHQLTHGKGGYQQAFEAVFLEQFKSRTPMLEAAFQDCIQEGGQCDFALLWLRLCERLDAFWCRQLGVTDAMALQRYSHSGVPLMPLVTATHWIPESPTDREARDHLSQIEELRGKNHTLMAKNVELQAQLAELGKRYGALKRQ